MLPTTHLLAPVLLLIGYQAVSGREFSDRELAFAAVAGILSDLLNPHIALAERASISHSLLFLVPIAVGVVFARDRWGRYPRILLMGVAVHILLDILSNPYNFLYPLRFDPMYPVLAQCGLGVFLCWFLVDVVLLTLFVLWVVRTKQKISL